MELVESVNNIGDIWKFVLIDPALQDIDIWMDLNSIDYSKYISNWEDAITLLKEYVEEHNISPESTEKEAEAFMDFVLGCFSLAMISCVEADLGYAQDGILAWVSQVADYSNNDGAIADIFDSVTNGESFHDGLILDTFMRFTTEFYKIDYDSEEIYDEYEGTNWEEVSEQIGAEFL